MRLIAWYALTFFILLVLLMLSLSIGAYKVYSLQELISIIMGGGSPVDKAVIELRFWRSVAAISIGACLSIAGLVIQRILGNPMADPYILGISPGAALGYMVAVASGLSLPLWYVASITGGMVAYFTVISIASLVGLTSLALIVVGVSVSYIFNSLTLIVIYLAGPHLGLATTWLFGTIAYTNRESTLTLVFVTITGLTLIVLSRGALTTLLLGEEVSKALGVNVDLLRLSMSAIVAVMVAVVTATSGPIGFIGLTAPWIARIVVGADFTRMIPITLVIGATICLGSDVIVRFIGGGRELPLTAITALIGAPLLFYLSVRGRSVGRL